MSRKSTPSIKVRDEGDRVSGTNLNPLTTSAATRSASANRTPFAVLHSEKTSSEGTEAKPMSTMEDILCRLKLNDSRKVSPPTTDTKPPKPDFEMFDKLVNNLQDQSKTLKRQEKELKNEADGESNKASDRSSGSTIYTPNTDASGSQKPVPQSSGTGKVDMVDLMRVKQELEAARSVISRQEQELAETRTLKHTMDQAMGPPSEVDFGAPNDISEQTIGHLQSAFNASARPFTSRNESWAAQEAQRQDQAEVLSTANFGRGRGIWNNTSGSMADVLNANASVLGYNNPRDARAPGQYPSVYGGTISPVEAFPPRNLAPPPAPFSYDMRPGNDVMQFNPSLGVRRNNGQLRINPGLVDPLAQYGNLSGTASALTPPPISPLGMPAQFSYQRALTSPMSPPSTEFPVNGIPGTSNPWTVPATGANGQTYITPLEPMNYRRLLDKSVSCDWKYIVDKIVCNNDQQASIFLQQKLKVGTAEQKFEIVESIVAQAYPLMINRFGNFLVQRCFEHGTPDQVVAIANAVHGNVIALSMDPFGCHVIQKAFDSVPEDHKAAMVRELLRRIPDTVIHRYACHVWQKLFELRWSGEPPQIMLEVNKALRGMWHEVALGETGSLVVQNIFENCIEEEKRPAIEEVITNIDLIAHGQFGNWCIQHLCEHGSPPDKRRVIDHILANSYNYSIDQFASKVVEKCLKIGGSEFLDRYLGVITTAHPDRPRIPLIDIAGDQYGNYLIQWILMNTHHHQREQVAIHIRKHMVSLRGSKFGSRVAMLCCNPNSVTRPGPGASVNPFGAPGQPRSQWPRFR
ncbi:hypothetical protein H2204_010339 [Knufia peltigerae]|uniref:PUM-HD domain-containing protein n=1 Tax=Knufia peltigerae TaxID=1002370 RepID=A0AA38XWB7_9EURO|nr:hypothetical protein H2204_010339 [Knufia peltigerae]